MTTKTGIQENAAGLLCYVLGWVTGIIMLILEPDNKYVRFHAIQSIIIFGALSIVSAVFGWIFFWMGWAIGILSLILWIVLMVKAYQGERFKVILAGDIAAKNSQ